MLESAELRMTYPIKAKYMMYDLDTLGAPEHLLNVGCGS